MSSDTFQRFDEVDGRVRPMRVAVNYVGRMPGGGITPGENLYAVTASELRKRHEYTLNGMTEPFDLEDVVTDTELRAEFEARKISADIVDAIRQVIKRDSYAPKCESVCDGQILIAVCYNDLPQRAVTLVSADKQEEVVLTESGAWRMEG